MTQEHDVQEEEMEPQSITFNDENGQEVEMLIVFTFQMKEQDYAVLLEKNNPDQDGVIMRVEEEEEEAYLVSIDDDDEWQQVVNVYEELVQQQS